MKIYSSIIALLVSLTFLWFIGGGCSKKSEEGAKDTTGTSTGTSQGSEGGIGGITSYNILPDNLLKLAYDQTPEGFLTLYDIIERDRINGILTAADALIQKICYFYNNACLSPAYAIRIGGLEEPFDGTTLLPSFYASLLQLSPEDQSRVLDVWESIVGIDSAEPSLSIQKAAPGKASPQEERIVKLSGGITITMPDGTCFIVRNDDPGKKEFKGLTEHRQFTADDVLFEIFYSGETADVATMVQNSFQQLGFVGKIRQEISDAVPKAADFGTNCNTSGAYRLLVVPGNLFYYGLAYMAPMPTGSYIVFIKKDMNKCRPTKFIRSSLTCVPGGQDRVIGAAIHEYFHAVEDKFFKDVGKHMHLVDPCLEALAEASVELYSQTEDLVNRTLPRHLYQPQTTLCAYVGNKQYGSTLLFWYLEDVKPQDGKRAIKTYLEALKGGSDFYEALRSAAAPIGDFDKVWHQFAESGLNLKQSLIYRFPSKHPNYLDDVFLSAGANLMTVDGKGGGTRLTVNLKGLLPLGIRYIAFVDDEFGNAWNNFIKFTPKKLDGGFSVFGITVNKDNPQIYRVTYHGLYDKNQGESMEVCFDEPDTEPDILILVFSNPKDPGDPANVINSEVQIESYPYCKPFPVKITDDYSYPSGGTKWKITVEGNFDSRYNRTWEENSFILSLDPWLLDGYVSWDRPELNYTALNSPVTVTWDYDYHTVTPGDSCTDYSTGTGITRHYTTYIDCTSDGHIELGPEDYSKRYLYINIWPDLSDAEIDEIELWTGTGQEIIANIQCNKTASPRASCAPNEISIDTWALPNCTYFTCKGGITPGSNTLNCIYNDTRPLSEETQTYMVTLPEPMEKIDSNNKWRLIYPWEAPKLPHQLVTPVLDEVVGIK